ncbi:trehalose operon repressor [Collinsella intestinalis]|uniref:trehalose operon repressor n=1 Tax=Collinsella intestinalis TaxID=147207 RepID=UPI001959F514|nr:trehalose operon repressor [Collinsella intestinalis]MBM6683424.1 trehalose operon repressor [Collinsella intestinalis]
MKARYDRIFTDLRAQIESGTFPYQELLPSESSLTATYDCSHNTIRRALALLREKGYVQPVQGKGVRVIWRPRERATFEVGGVESFRESVARNRLTAETRVSDFRPVVCDKRLAELTGHPEGADLITVERVRLLDGRAGILDRSYFLADRVPGLTPQIAEGSIYTYLEDELGIEISTSKRTITVEPTTEHDRAMLDLGDADYLAVMTSQTFDKQGLMFEFTTSRHHPEMFCFHDTAVRSAV